MCSLTLDYVPFLTVQCVLTCALTLYNVFSIKCVLLVQNTIKCVLLVQNTVKCVPLVQNTCLHGGHEQIARFEVAVYDGH